MLIICLKKDGNSELEIGAQACFSLEPETKKSQHLVGMALKPYTPVFVFRQPLKPAPGVLNDPRQPCASFKKMS